MSRPRKNLTVAKPVAKRVAAWLGKMPTVQSVWLGGSRSPLTTRKPRRDSDWDFVVVSDAPNLRLQSPRETTWKLHADVLILSEPPGKERGMVQLFPEDTHGVFTPRKAKRKRKRK